jgi:hypothetical protein
MALAPVPTLPAYTDELDPFFLQNLQIIFKTQKGNYLTKSCSVKHYLYN